MIDLSAKNVTTTCKTPQSKIAMMIHRFHVTEKFDGTKLTLYRNSAPWCEDYTKNWVISYKGNVISKEEFDGIVDFVAVKTQSIGTSQYYFVHKHIEAIHHNTKDIPLNSEFFVEFIQNKPTLTRDYQTLHGMFLISGGESLAYQRHSRIFLSCRRVFTSSELSEYSKALSIPEPPVLFSGVPNFSFDRMLRKYRKFESVLGGPAEGVVIKIENGKLFKVVRRGQYDQQIRKEKKLRWAFEDKNEENHYWRVMRKQARSILKTITEKDELKSTSSLSKIVYSLNDDQIDAKNEKKCLMIRRDDLFLTAKLIQQNDRVYDVARSIAFFPMAGKPVHAGHWAMINLAASQNERLVVVVSTKDRSDDYYVSGIKMFDIWIDILFQHLPSNVELKCLIFGLIYCFNICRQT